jgi:hypothetical protein
MHVLPILHCHFYHLGNSKLYVIPRILDQWTILINLYELILIARTHMSMLMDPLITDCDMAFKWLSRSTSLLSTDICALCDCTTHVVLRTEYKHPDQDLRTQSLLLIGWRLAFSTITSRCDSRSICAAIFSAKRICLPGLDKADRFIAHI